MSTRNRWVQRLVLFLHRLHPREFRERFGADFRTDLRLAIEPGPPAVLYRVGRLALIWDSLKTLARSWGARLSPSGAGGPRREPRSSGRDPWTDVRTALRMIRRRPLPALVTILTLAIGIGANSAVFTVFHSLLLAPLPYQDADRVTILERNAVRIGADEDWFVVDAVSGAPGVESTAYYLAGGSTNLVEGSTASHVRLAQVSNRFFDVIGVPAVVGSTLDAFPDRKDVATLSYGLWVRAFGSDPEVVGSEVYLTGRRFQVTGVAAPEAGFPGKTEIWIPGPTIYDFFGGAVAADAVVRLAENADPGVVQGEIARRMERNAAEEGETFELEAAPTLLPLRETLSNEIQTPIAVLIVTTGMILLLACANLTAVALAHLMSRVRELRSRIALGATRWRIARQLFVEALVTATLAGFVSLALAALGVPALVSLLPAETPGLEAVQFGFAGVLSTVLVTVIAGVFIGLLPAFEGPRMATRGNLNTRRTDERRVRRFREGLVIMQVGVAAVLLIGSALLLKSLLQLWAVPQGYDVGGVVTFQVRRPTTAYDSPERQRAYFREAQDRISRLPGVQGVGAVTQLPLGEGATIGYSMWPTDVEESSRAAAIGHQASPSYFDAMGIEFLEGGPFKFEAGPEPEVVVSARVAEQLFPEGSAVGQRVTVDLYSRSIDARIVGVVSDVRQFGFSEMSFGTFYRPLGDSPSPHLGFAVQVAEPVAERVRDIRATLAQVDPLVPPFAMRTTRDAVAAQLAERRAVSLVVGLIAVLASLLVAIGLYGVLAHGVMRRRREIGIRMALGAQGRSLVRSVVVRALALTSIGVSIGLGVAVLTVGKLEDLLYQVQLTDPGILVGTPCVVLLLTLIASWFPAWTAARIDPAAAFRTE